MRPQRHLTLASILLLSANTTNCSLTGPVDHLQGDFRHSVSTFQCGPADGPATAVLLAHYPFDGVQPGNPHVRVIILRAVTELSGTSWNVGMNFNDAGALYNAGSGDPEQATSGTVRITRVVAQERVEGTVDLRFPSRQVTEEFSAPWIEQLILCG